MSCLVLRDFIRVDRVDFIVNVNDQSIDKNSILGTNSVALWVNYVLSNSKKVIFVDLNFEIFLLCEGNKVFQISSINVIANNRNEGTRLNPQNHVENPNVKIRINLSVEIYEEANVTNSRILKSRKNHL